MTVRGNIPETIAERYSIGRMVGLSIFGAIYEARDLETDRVVALRVAQRQVLGDLANSAVARARAAVLLPWHQNIIQVYDAGEDHGICYAAVEFFDSRKLLPSGEHLRPHLPSGALSTVRAAGGERSAYRLSGLSDAMAVTLQLLEALKHAHNNGYVRGDLKGSDILIKQFEIKLTDFGLALGARAAAKSGRGIAAHEVGWWRLILAPEMLNGNVAAEPRSDLFAVGVILFELLTGILPWTGETYEELVENIRRHPAPPISAFVEWCPPGLDDVVARSLEKNPANRFQAADEMSRELVKLFAPASCPRELIQEPISPPGQAAPEVANPSKVAATRGVPPLPSAKLASYPPDSRNGIFITYRREDVGPMAALLLYDKLVKRFGRERVFMDIDNISPGEDFVDVIERMCARSAVFLVLIGQKWASITDRKGRRRLNNTNDYVRLEVSRGLASGVCVIPVLLENAEIPDPDLLPEDLKKLAFRHALEISPKRIEYDLSQLIGAIERVLQSSSEL